MMGGRMSWFKYCGARNRFMLLCGNQIDLLSYSVTKPGMYVHVQAATHCVRQIVKTATVPNAVHKSSNLQKAKYGFRSARGHKSGEGRPSYPVGCKRRKEKIFCTVAMVFPFHSESFSRRAPGVSALQLIDLFLIVPPLSAEWDPASAGVSVAPSLDIYICSADKSPETPGHFWGRIELLVMR